MRSTRRPSNRLERTLVWVLAGFVAVNLLLIVPAFASEVRLDRLHPSLPIVNLRPLAAGRARITDGLGEEFTAPVRKLAGELQQAGAKALNSILYEDDGALASQSGPTEIPTLPNDSDNGEAGIVVVPSATPTPELDNDPDNTVEPTQSQPTQNPSPTLTSNSGITPTSGLPSPTVDSLETAVVQTATALAMPKKTKLPPATPTENPWESPTPTLQPATLAPSPTSTIAPTNTPSPPPKTKIPPPTSTQIPSYTPTSTQVLPQDPTMTPTQVAVITATLVHTAVQTASPTPVWQSSPSPTLGPTDTPVISPTSTATIPSGVYYVAPYGDDSAPGTLDQPWKTIRKAADTLVAGDTVYVRAGTYAEQVVPKNSGEPGKHIRYLAYPGEAVLMQGQASLRNAFAIVGKRYLTIDGFEMAGYVDRGVYITQSSNLVISNNLIRDWRLFGIEAEDSSSYLEIAYNEVIGSSGSVANGIWATDTQYSDFHHNVVHENLGNGIGLSHGSQHNSIRDNFVYNNGLTSANNLAGIAIEVHSSYNVVYNNIVANNHHAGILTNSQFNEFFNNLVYSSADPTGDGGSFYCVNWSGSICSNNTIKNNIFIATGGDEKTVSIQSIEGRENTFDHNMHWHMSKPVTYDVISWFGTWMSFSEWQSAFDQDVNGLYADPLLVGGNLSDPLSYRLGPSSMAIDSGDTLPNISNDFLGTPRPQGALYDIGAYER